MLVIVAAAVRDAAGRVHTLPAPARHPDIQRAMSNAAAPYPWTEGFVDEGGSFMNRAEAMRHARQLGQLRPRNQPADPVGAAPRISAKQELYSEDLW